MNTHRLLAVAAPLATSFVLSGCSEPLLADLEPAAGRPSTAAGSPAEAAPAAVDELSVVVPSGLYRAANEPPPPDLERGVRLDFSSRLDAGQWEMVETHLADAIAISGGRSADVRIASVDLNADDADDAIVMVHSGPYCGSGNVCNLWIFEQTAGGWQWINGEDDAANAVYLLPESTGGYRDIGLRGSCGGEVCSFRVAWDGDSYEWVADPTPGPTASR